MSLATINAALSNVTGVSDGLAGNLASLIGSVSDTYAVIDEKGGNIPAHKNTSNLASTIGELGQ